MLRSQKSRVTSQCIWRICFVVVFWVPTLETALDQCKLCNLSYESCSMQFPQYNLMDEDCRMTVYRPGSEECNSLQLYVPDRGETSGRMLLQSYFYQTEQMYSQTAFNVSFMDFSWKIITMRYMENGDARKNSCRIFRFSEKFLSIKPTFLFYDCLWSLSGYERKAFTFEYAAQNEVSVIYRKSVFKVPGRDGINPELLDLEKRELFVYVDITDNPLVILRVQTLPDMFNVSTYNVKAYRGTEHNKTVKEDKNITVSRGEKEFTFEWNLGIFPGNYFFEVRPVSKVCGHSGCLASRSPYINVEPSSSLFLAAGVSAVVVLVLVIITCVKYMPRGKTMSGRPRLLLIYRPTHVSHVKVVLELAQHLWKNCNIETMFDERDVHKSETHDPFLWYNDAISQADYIAIVSSPTCCNAINGIFPKAYEIALNLLQGKEFKRKPMSNMCNVMVFMLPYCSEKNLPPEAKNIGLHFRIPGDIDAIVDYAHNFRRKYFIGRLYYCLRNFFSWYMHRERVFCKKFPELSAVIQEASSEVKQCLSLESRTDIAVERDRTIPIIIYGKSFHETLDQPSNSMKRVSESAECSLIYGCFPGRIGDYLDLHGEETEVLKEEELKPGEEELRPDNKEILLLDELNL